MVKNKLSAPFRIAEFDILFNEGISREGDILDLALAEKLMQKSGAWFSMNGENLGQGRENTRQYLRDNPDVADELRRKVLEAKGLLNAGGNGSTSEAVEEEVGSAEE